MEVEVKASEEHEIRARKAFNQAAGYLELEESTEDASIKAKMRKMAVEALSSFCDDDDLIDRLQDEEDRELFDTT